MVEGNPKELFQSVMQLAANDKIREPLSAAKCLAAAAQIRSEGDRISTAARALAGGEKKIDSVVPALPGFKGMFGQMEGDFRTISGMLEGLANKELAAVFSLTIPPERAYADAHFLRSRVLADVLAASSYYKVSAELISLAMKTLDKCSPSMKAGETALLLDHAAALLGDAAKFMATAGVELGDSDVRWKSLTDAVERL
ncbi:MAG: hypothetical protein CVU64_01500 [Deltaproteobacteria bacterium HGW-Deltaproteobacteria-21]|nr:MAG: hypothetical protein CVU64_01500 [Deltaproteobacteria bacterium HGW-Deltaproteobacteria-21]